VLTRAFLAPVEQARQTFGEEEAGRLLGADFAALGRYESDDAVTLVAAWSRTGDSFPVGNRWTLEGEHQRVRLADRPPGPGLTRSGVPGSSG
jgi:hypothetical protein